MPASPSTILICDDDELIRWSLSEYLRARGYRTAEAADGRACLERVAEQPPALLLLDLQMPELDGLGCLRELRRREVDLPVVVLTAHGALDSAIEATRLGAESYLTKPCDLALVAESIGQALEQHRLRTQLGTSGGEAGHYHGLIGASPSMGRVFEVLRRLESVDSPTVLITGESGTGKELVARAIHGQGSRRDEPFMEVDCTAIPAPLFESTLFGHEKGAFTDARQAHPGLFESAAGGVVFLDEIGELDLGVQVKLLRSLESRRFRRVGGTAEHAINAAVVVATNRDLREEVAAGRFRQDLYYRLAVVPIRMPALRERVEDIAVLVHHFLGQLDQRLGRPIEGVSGEALALLQAYRWPGNVRELRNILERAAIFSDGRIIEAAALPAEIRLARGGGPAEAGPFALPEGGVDLEAVERGLIDQALARARGNQTAAARLLHLSRYALRYRLKKHGLMPR